MTDELYRGIDNLEVLAGAVRYNRFLVDAVSGVGSGCRTAVDFGAGTGALTAAVRDRGLAVACVEPDPRLRRQLQERGFAVYEGIETVPDASQEFMYSLNVLEHIEDDRGTLSVLYSKLKPGGRLFVYVPAFALLFSSMDRKIGHHRRYHKRDLLRMSRRAGFTIERVEYADSLGFFATLLYKLVGGRTGDVSPTALRLYDRFVFPVSRMLDRAGLSFVIGKNLMVVMRRPFSVPDMPPPA
jgi:SAM-dependent methyltransferase